MEIVSRQNYHELLLYLPHIKASLAEWKLVDIRLTGNSEKYFAISRIVDMLHSLFSKQEGKIYLCKGHETFMLIRWGQDNDPQQLVHKIEEFLSAVSCEITVHDPTPEGLQKLEIPIRYEEESGTVLFVDTRYTRKENVVILATNDKNTRMLVKEGIPKTTIVHRAANGPDILADYKKYVPDAVLLDMHLKDPSGLEILQEILTLDPDAYVIMLTIESAAGNMEETLQKGAKGYITIPFSHGQLQEYLNKCPTMSIRRLE